MAFKFIIFAIALATSASAGYVSEQPLYGGGLGVAYSSAPAVSSVYNSYGLASIDDHLSVGVSNQNIVRSYDGTISQISKKVVSPTSVFTKYDTRINNAGIKTLAYAQPALSYAQPQLIAQPAYGYASQKLIAQPALSYAQPAYGYASQKLIAQPALSYAQPALAYSHHQPALLGSQTYVKAAYASPVANYAW